MLIDKQIMRRIGQKALTFQFPAVIDGEVSYIGPEEFLGRWLFLSFVPTFEKSDNSLWNRQGKELAKLGAALLVVPSETQMGKRRRSASLEHMYFTVVGDPLSRLQRLYGGSTTQSAGRGRTFLVDPAGSLRFHLVHSLTDQGMRILTEVLLAHQDMDTGSRCNGSRLTHDPRRLSIGSILIS